MSRQCYCRFCGRPTDCGGIMCELCEVLHLDEIEQCPGGHCDICLEEVKPGVFKFKGEDGSYYLKRVNE